MQMDQIKVYISCSVSDYKIYKDLADKLGQKCEVVKNLYEYKEGSFVYPDIFIPIITKNFLSSFRAQAESRSVILGKNNIAVLPVVIGKIPLPYFMKHLMPIPATNKEDIIQKVLSNVEEFSSYKKEVRTLDVLIEENNKEKISSLKKSIEIENIPLTLVCGTGVSIPSSIPNWNQLLVNILTEIYSNDYGLNTKDRISVQSLLSLMPQSNLISAKYLKELSKNKARFYEYVKTSLYRKFNEDSEKNLETDMLKAIAKLSSTTSTTKRLLESIITLNFDDLIERKLLKEHIKYASIWNDVQKHSQGALPIFHVHGFLPNQEKTKPHNLVFSEEAYHSQFIEPYTWSNLKQLNTFSSNICLFVGLSLTDPNLRRLLDISHRNDQQFKHYIIKEIPQVKAESEITRISMDLFELDAMSLGLNVIWCSDYLGIPKILDKISDILENNPV